MARRRAGAVAAAALTGLPVRDAVRQLDLLADVDLLQERPDGRYVRHDLVAAHLTRRAAELVPDADPVASRLDDPVSLICTLTNVGRLHLATGRPDEAATALEESLRIAEDHHDSALTAKVMVELGPVRAAQGDRAGALAVLATARDLARQAADAVTEAESFQYAAELLPAGSAEAAREARAAHRIFRTLGDPRAGQLEEQYPDLRTGQRV